MEENQKYKNISIQISAKHQQQTKRVRISQKNKIKIKVLDDDPQINNQKQNIYNDEQDSQSYVKQEINKKQTQEKKKIGFETHLQKSQYNKKQNISHRQPKRNKKQPKVIKQINIKQQEVQQDNQKSLVQVQIINNKQETNQKIKIHTNSTTQQTKKPQNLQNNNIESKQTRQIKIKIKSSKLFKNQKFDSSLEKQTDNMSRKTFRSTRSSCEDYLDYVFNYYCKLNYPFANDPTFQQISSNTKTMRMTNFLIFCRDFKIRQKIQRTKLVQAFKKYSYFHKYLKPLQFQNLIKYLASILFQNYQEDKKFGKMLIFLELHDSFSFVKKMNQLGVVFRMKNKRGVQINLTPKYTFKLTPNNGKNQQQIALQVKQRRKLRQIVKLQKLQWHRKNKLNKIDQLYRKAAEDKARVNQKNKGIYQLNYILNQQKDFNNNLARIRHDQDLITPIQISRVCKGYYNPSQILTIHRDKTYRQISQLKKKNYNSIQRLQKYQNRDRNSLIKTHKKYLNIKNIITMAKNTIRQQQINFHKQIKQKPKYFRNINKNIQKDFNTRQFSISDQMNHSKYIPRQFSISRLTNSSANLRNSQQIKQAQKRLEQQIKNIPTTIYHSKVIPKQFLRATAKADKQNIRQINQLVEMIGIYSQEDQILKQHFSIQRNYEQKINKF